MQALAAGIAALVLVPGTVMAQAHQCRVPQGPVSVPAVEPDGPVRKRPIHGYTLALSWSPEYCRHRTGPSRSTAGTLIGPCGTRHW